MLAKHDEKMSCTTLKIPCSRSRSHSKDQMQVHVSVITWKLQKQIYEACPMYDVDCFFWCQVITGGQLPDVRGLRGHLFLTVTFFVWFRYILLWQYTDGWDTALCKIPFDKYVSFDFNRENSLWTRRIRDQDRTVHVADTHPHRYQYRLVEGPCQTFSDIIIQTHSEQGLQVNLSQIFVAQGPVVQN